MSKVVEIGEEGERFTELKEEENETEQSGSSAGISDIWPQLREVFRIYTSNQVKCAICDPKSESFVNFVYA